MIKLKHQLQYETSGTLKQSSKQKVCFSIRYCDLYALPRIDNVETNHLASWHKYVPLIDR